MIGDRTAHDLAAPRVVGWAAVDPSITCAVLGDVGKPHSIQAISGELPLNQIIMGWRIGAMSALMAVADAMNVSVAHRPCHAFSADPKPSYPMRSSA